MGTLFRRNFVRRRCEPDVFTTYQNQEGALVRVLTVRVRKRDIVDRLVLFLKALSDLRYDGVFEVLGVSYADGPSGPAESCFLENLSKGFEVVRGDGYVTQEDVSPGNVQ